MALVPCPECGKQVSTKAAACPECGCPISSDGTDQKQMVEAIRPDLADNLSVGRTCFTLSGATVKGYCGFDETPAPGLPAGKVYLDRRKNGLRILGDGSQTKDLHFSQIMEIGYVDQSISIEDGKSVLKRAAVGTVLLGPLGAVVGGMTGVGKKQKTFKGCVKIRYWETENDYPFQITIAIDDARVGKDLCKKTMEEMEKRQQLQTV